MLEIRLGSDSYSVSPTSTLTENFENLERWFTLEKDGLWRVENGALTGEWLCKSPSIFLKEKVHGDYLWQIDATRIAPDERFVQRFKASKWGADAEPLNKYNFNFWIRADAPPGEDFIQQYPQKLGSGWNGMGDDYWHSYFNTIVWDEKDNWIRLRRSPGYEMVADVHNVAPFMPYGAKHRFTFVIHSGRVRGYCDDTRLYDYADPSLHASGYIGLCVWLVTMRFESMKLYRF